MPPPHVLRDAVLQLNQRPTPRPPLEQGIVQVLRRVPAGSPDDDCRALLVPFQNGTRTDAEATPHLGRDRDLALRGYAGVSKGHAR
jgi:hypothetical protein